MLNDHVARNQRREMRPQRPAWPTLKRALLLHRPHLAMVTLLLVVVVGYSVLGLAPALLIQRIIDKALPTARDVHGDSFLLNVLIVLMVIAVGMTSLIGVAQTYLSNLIGQDVMYDLRRDLYRHLTGMSLRWFTANKTGEVLSRVSNDVGAVQSVVSDTIVGMCGNLITAGSTFTLMLFLDWRLALFSVAFLPIFIIPARRVGNVQRALVNESQEQLAVLNGQMQETLSVSGVLLVKTFGRQAGEIARFEDTARDIKVLNVRRAMVGRWFQMAMGVFASLAPAVVYWYGGREVIGGSASLGTVVASGTLLTRMFQPVTQLTNANITVLSSLALFERLFDYLDLNQEIADKPGAVALERPRGDLAFEHVTFSYIKDTPALRDISFEVPSGQFAALVGHSGAGKTTTAYLIPRLYDVGSGRITVDGHDIRDLTLDSLGAAIGMVNQEPFLFHDTIRMNLRYGLPEATDAEVERAARAANIPEFIASLPFGYDTIVGERGYRLSGGEKQRVAIARALLKDPAILILDEATSSVDSQTERAIQDALERLTRGRTVVAIAHRLSTILAADVILVFDHGRIVERGRHAELLALGGVYASLYRQQFAEESPGVAAGG
ncbi:MAG TPA: ABC transporter ATP-binding protein [Tepidiformaceae bacterium]|nr:ABC transporter ATP-binding protein [Tepidiformaceae bacterium]